MQAATSSSIPAAETAATRRTLWAATVRTKSLAERLLAARAGGFTAQSAFPLDVKSWLSQGQTLAALRDQARAGGAPITTLDPLTQWLPRWQPPASMSGPDRAFVEFDQPTFFGYATELGVEKVSVIESFGTRYELAELVAAFQRICDAAQERNLLVQVEFMPFGSIPDLATAWEIVRRAGRDNGGLVFDTWHYYRGRPDNALLRQVPGEKVFSVQLADATSALQGGSLFADLMHYRRVPGEGDFPLAEVVTLLHRSGGLADVGVEVFSDVLDGLAAEAAGERAGAGMRQLLATATAAPRR